MSTNPTKSLLSSYSDLAKVSVGLDEFFDGFFPNTQESNNWPSWTNNYFPNLGGFPPFDYFKTKDNKYVLRLAVPGFTKEQLTVKVFKNVLYVEGKAEKKEGNIPTTKLDTFAFGDPLPTPDSEETEMERAAKEISFHSKIGYKSFNQKFNLPPHAEILHASLENGILEIVVQTPKKEEEAKEIEINIQ